MGEDSSVGYIAASHYSGDIWSHAGIRQRADWVITQIERLKPDFIAVRGISGMSIGFAVSALYDIPIVVVRKGEQAHTNTQVHGEVMHAGRYVIVDDFVDHGETVRTIHSMVRDATDGASKPELLAVVCYANPLARYVTVDDHDHEVIYRS